jgi:hypothetical protein
MANPSELPELVNEFVDMSKEYLLQETVEPAKTLGRYAGFTIGASFSFALGVLFLSIAMLRTMIRLLPDGPYWSALGYILTALVLAGVAAVIVSTVNRLSTPKEEPVIEDIKEEIS